MLGALLPVSLHLESCTRAWDMGTGNALSCMRMHGEVRWWVVLLAMAHGGAVNAVRTWNLILITSSGPTTMREMQPEMAPARASTAMRLLLRRTTGCRPAELSSSPRAAEEDSGE